MITNKINGWLFRTFGFSIRRMQCVNKHKPRNNSLVWAFTVFDIAYRCRYYNGKFLSLNDGKPIESVFNFIQI